MTPLKTVLLGIQQRWNLEAPECVVEEDGELGLDWSLSKNAAVSLSISDTGRVSYAALIGEFKCHGTFIAGEWPDEIHTVFDMLTRVPVSAPSAPQTQEEQ